MSSTTVNLKVVLLDDSEIEISVQQRLISSDFRDIVTSQVNIRETQYFGLSYEDENGYTHWLQEDRRVLDHDFPRRGGTNQKPPLLYLGIKYFAESISYLSNSITYEQFYLQSRKLIAKGELECDSETVFYLGALAMQITHGDFVSHSEARTKIRKMPVLPLRTLKQHPSLDFCEGKVIDHYQTMAGMQKGDAMLEYLEMIQRLPSYGIHFFEVKSTSGIPWWLGVGNSGISIFDHNDRRTARETFSWERIENFFYRDKKFSLIVLDPKRISSSRRSFVPGNTKTHVWHAITAALAKTIYCMAESTKHFCMDTAEKQKLKNNLPRPPTRNNVAYEITHRRHSFCRPVHAASVARAQQGSTVTLDRHRSIHPLSSTTHNSRSHGSLHTFSTGVLDSSVVSGSGSGIATTVLEELAAQQLNQETNEVFDNSGDPYSGDMDEEMTEEAKEELFQMKKARYEQLEEKKNGLIKLFEQKLEQLKAVCMEEAELTGELPEEYPLLPHEKPPTVRKRIGATFALSPLLVNTPQTPSFAGDGTPQLPPRFHGHTDTPVSSGVGVVSVDGLSCISPAVDTSNLSIEYELQKQIVSAKVRLTQEKTATKSVRKQRKDDLKKAREKLRQLELRLNGVRKSSLDSSLMTLSLTASSRGSLDEQISEGQLSLTGSSNEMLMDNTQVNPYNTVSGVPAYMSPNVNARRRVLNHSRGSLPEFSTPPVIQEPYATSGTSRDPADEFRRDSYASQKSLPASASISRSRNPARDCITSPNISAAGRRRHNRSHHCSPARARPAIGAHLDGDLDTSDASGQFRLSNSAGVGVGVLCPDQACDSGFVSLHTPSTSQKRLTNTTSATSTGAITVLSEDSACVQEDISSASDIQPIAGSAGITSGLDLSPSNHRRNLLLYHHRFPYHHPLSNSDSQLTSTITSRPGDIQNAPSFGPTGTLKTGRVEGDASQQPAQFWYQPPQDLDFLSASDNKNETKKNYWYTPTSDSLEPSELVGDTVTTNMAASPASRQSNDKSGGQMFIRPPPVEFEKPLETADCLQYSEETRRRLAAAQRNCEPGGNEAVMAPPSVISGSGSDLDRRLDESTFESVAEDFSSEMFSWYDSKKKGTYV